MILLIMVRAREVEVVEPCTIIILEGLFALYWANVRSLLGLKVYVTTDEPICFERRLARDVRARGRSAESVRRQYETTVRPMAEQYIYPTRAFADLVVSGTDRLDKTSATVVSFINAQHGLL